MNCPICGTPFQVKVTDRMLESVYYLGETITVWCRRCNKSDVFTTDKGTPVASARDWAQESFAYSLENQQDAQAQRLAIQLADLAFVRDSLTKRLVTSARGMIDVNPTYHYVNPEWFGCRACGRSAERAEDIQHTVYNSLKGKSYNCPLGAVQIAIDYLTSIQPAVTRGNDYDSGRRFIP